MWLWLTEAVLDNNNCSPKYRGNSRNELQRGRRVVRPHNQCEYKPGDKWSVLGQSVLLPPCEQENEEEKKQEEVHLGERIIFQSEGRGACDENCGVVHVDRKYCTSM